MPDLILRETAIEAIKKAKNSIKVPRFKSDNQLEVETALATKDGCDLAMFEVDNLPSPWVSVKSKLPEKSGYYIAVVNHGGFRSVEIADYRAPLHTWIRANGSFSDRLRVTHWMLLPDPPAD